MIKPKLIVIVGPTASGKTALSLALARSIGAEIIAADSRTVYRGMDIGTAKPAPDGGELAAHQDIGALFAPRAYAVEGVPHWGFDLVEPDELFTAADFKKYAEQKIAEIIERGHVPMLVGGTGLYIRAVVDNLSFTDATMNLELRRELEAMSDKALLEELFRLDEEAAETVDVKNRRRVVRAVEILRETGESLGAQRVPAPGKYDVLELAPTIDREVLYERINERVDVMIAKGLVAEVRGLVAKYGASAQAMTGIGYRQIAAFLAGQMPLREAIEIIKRDSRHYSKRQMTWFQRDERIRYVKSAAEALVIAEEFLAK